MKQNIISSSLPMEELVHHEQFLELAELLPHMVWIALPSGYNIYQNKRFYDFSGLTPQEAKGDGWANVLHPDDKAHTSAAWEKACNIGEPYEIEYRFRGVDGLYRWFLTRAEPKRNEQGKILYWFGTNTDIDDKKRLEEDLQRLNTELDSFVHMASHDLKSPIVNMESLLKLLLKKVEPLLDQEGKEITALFGLSLHKLAQTVKDISTVSQASGTITQAEPICFSQVLEEVKQDLKPLLIESKASLEVNFQVEQISFPHKHLRSILYNLLSNSLKYRSLERIAHVVVTTVKEGNTITLAVGDNGLGLSPIQLHKLFTLFSRFHPGVEGTGIGLYLLKRIVDNYKGKIRVESTEGQGTTFFIQFNINN